MRGGVFPTSEVIARVLILAAAHMDELSAWVKADEAVLRGDIEISSRWVALATLTAMYPTMQPHMLGLYVGTIEAVEGLAYSRSQSWWSEDLVTRVMVETLRDDLPHVLGGNGAAHCAEAALRGLLQSRLRVIHRSAGHGG